MPPLVRLYRTVCVVTPDNAVHESCMGAESAPLQFRIAWVLVSTGAPIQTCSDVVVRDTGPVVATEKTTLPARAAVTVHERVPLLPGRAGVTIGFDWSCSRPVTRSITVSAICAEARLLV